MNQPVHVSSHSIGTDDRLFAIDVELEPVALKQAGEDAILFGIPHFDGWFFRAVDRDRAFDYAELAEPGQEQHAGERWGSVRHGRWKYLVQRYDTPGRNALSIEGVVEAVRSAVTERYAKRLNDLQPHEIAR